MVDPIMKVVNYGSLYLSTNDNDQVPYKIGVEYGVQWLLMLDRMTVF